jgi:signal transduction histidine kinase
MGGDLSIENHESGGACARVRLPVGVQTLAKEPRVHNRAPHS